MLESEPNFTDSNEEGIYGYPGFMIIVAALATRAGLLHDPSTYDHIHWRAWDLTPEVIRPLWRGTSDAGGIASKWQFEQLTLNALLVCLIKYVLGKSSLRGYMANREIRNHYLILDTDTRKKKAK